MTSLYKSSTLGLIKRLGVAARWFFVASLSARVFSVFIHLPPIIYKEVNSLQRYKSFIEWRNLLQLFYICLPLWCVYL